MKNVHILLAALTISLLAVPFGAEAGWSGHGKGTKTYKATKTYKSTKSHTSYKAAKSASWEAHKAAKADKWKKWQESIAAYKAQKAEKWNNWLESKKAYKASKTTKTYVAKPAKSKTWDKSWKSHKKTASKAK